MSDVQRLLDAFESGRLLRPDAGQANSVDLARALAKVAGVEGPGLGEHAQHISAMIEGRDHVVFVLVDGLGMHLLRGDGAPFLRAHARETLRAVFPTSTAPSLTSFATGVWPAEHAVPGWFTYLPHADITATILPFGERFSKEDARKHGASVEQAFPVEALSARFTRRHLRVVPKRIDGSVYSRYSGAGGESYGYRSSRDAIRWIKDTIGRASGPTFTYFYISVVDTAQHERGIGSKSTRRALKMADARIEELATAVGRKARIFVTADHGLIEIPPSRQHFLTEGDPLMELLRMAPSCEPRTPAFHVREGCSGDFGIAFRARYGEEFALLTIDEVDELRLVGPEPMTAETRRRLGDYVGVALEASIVSAPLERPMIGFHGGLHPDEVLVPLIVV